MNTYEALLRDMSLHSEFRILEEAKDKDKLLEIAQKRGIVLPAKDLAIFECIYGFVDRQNKNGCTIPKEEVEKSLATIAGKSIDIDHYRKNVVGHWLDAKLIGDKIIAYGCVFKASFREDFEIIQELFNKGNLSVSLEAWGDRKYNKDGSYTLSNIEFAGGALLLRSEPAFEGADVMELAKKRERVLEFASVMTAPKEFVHSRGKEVPEEARYNIYDADQILKAMSDVECLDCKECGYMIPTMMDFENNMAKARCGYCMAEMKINMTPQPTLTKKGRKIKEMSEWVTKANLDEVSKFIGEFQGPDERLESVLEESLTTIPKISYSDRQELNDEEFAIVKTVEIEKGKNRKLRIFPIHDLAQIEYAQEVLETEKATKLLEQLSISKDSVERKISGRVKNIAMDELLKKFKKSNVKEVIQELAKASLNRELTAEELEKSYSMVSLKGSSTASPTSINAPSNTGPETPANDNGAHKSQAPANATSLQKAMTEDEIKAIIASVIAKPEVAEVADLKCKLEAAEAKVAELTAQLTEANAKLEEANLKVKTIEDAEKASKVKVRRDSLGEFAKDLSDADIMDEVKFENASLKKKVAELEKSSTTTTVVKKEEADLTIGSTDKTVISDEVKTRNTINEMAYGPADKK